MRREDQQRPDINQLNEERVEVEERKSLPVEP
jgi:hypothetical protein